MSTSSFPCPRCQSKYIQRSHRRVFDWLMSIIGLKACAMRSLPQAVLRTSMSAVRCCQS